MIIVIIRRIVSADNFCAYLKVNAFNFKTLLYEFHWPMLFSSDAFNRDMMVWLFCPSLLVLLPMWDRPLSPNSPD